jgi:tetratricopeptide (TPR) repeat protein
VTSKRRAWLLLSFSALSCLKQGSTSAVQSGEPWVELRSQHFRVVSDLGEEQANRVIGSFEETYGLLGKVVFGGSAVPSFETNALIFEHNQDLTQFVGDGFGGQYMPWLPNDIEPAPTVLASGTLSPFARIVFTHELTHRFNHVALGPTPTWLNEGLADYYSTIRSEGDGPVVGEIDPRYMCTPDGLGDLECYQYDKLPGNRLPRASDVIKLDHETFYRRQGALEKGAATWEQKRTRSENYGVAWLLVHLLMHGQAAYAQQFRSKLAAPPSPLKGAELAEIVARVPAAQLDRDFHAYLQNSIPWRQHHAGLPKLPSDLSRRTLQDREVLLWWARLDAFDGKFARRAHDRLLAARDQPAAGADAAGIGAASFWLGRYSQLHNDGDQAAQHYRHALELEPGNPEYLYGLLNLYWADGHGMTWLQAARSVHVGQTIAELAHTARSASQLNAVAAYQLFAHDLPAALETSARACQASPDCWSCFHNRAAALSAAGQRSEAAEAEREAQSRLPEGAAADMVKLVSRSVDYYERAASDPSSVDGEPRPGILAP